MKKILSVFLCFITLFFCAGCNKEKNPPGEIYSLEEAYENGWITREHLLSIAYYFGGQKENNVELQDENYAPIPKNPEKLSKKMALKIRKTDLYMEQNEYDRKTLDLEDIKIIAYHGCYVGCWVVEVRERGTIFSDTMTEWSIGNVKFTYREGLPIVWKENKKAYS